MCSGGDAGYHRARDTAGQGCHIDTIASDLFGIGTNMVLDLGRKIPLQER